MLINDGQSQQGEEGININEFDKIKIKIKIENKKI